MSSNYQLPTETLSQWRPVNQLDEEEEDVLELMDTSSDDFLGDWEPAPLKISPSPPDCDIYTYLQQHQLKPPPEINRDSFYYPNSNWYHIIIPERDLNEFYRWLRQSKTSRLTHNYFYKHFRLRTRLRELEILMQFDKPLNLKDGNIFGLRTIEKYYKYQHISRKLFNKYKNLSANKKMK